ncbi:hypothetical protein JOC77_001347 [Peribacillus deserti]|uniref:G5 domain-containing protein n=1 Tax=Peribacillus deserti TaxID=673318 RepID=A0ABS2QFK2_9BACI|nr:VanW family protein [Peribacillus deserti]MBM7691937.1 hypothetical protein [Peribacillus deserti]
MGLSHNFYRVFLLLLISAIMVTFLSKAGTYAYENVFLETNGFKQNTSIAGIDVSKQSNKEAAAKIKEKMIQWQGNSSLTLTLFDQEVEFPMGDIHFLISESVATADQGIENKLYTDVNQTRLIEMLQDIGEEELVSQIDIKRLKTEIENWAGTLAQSNQIIYLEDMLVKNHQGKESFLSRSELSLKSGRSVDEWISNNHILTIQPGKSFSFLELVMSDNDHVLADDESSLIASAIYEAVLSSGLEVKERHTSTVLPDGIKPGYEAKIKRDESDLVLANESIYPYKIKLQTQNGRKLIVEVFGKDDSAWTYKARSGSYQSFEPKQIIQFKTGVINEQVINPGKPGYRIFIYRDVLDSNGKKLESKLMSQDFYLPVNKIMVKNKRPSIPENVTDSGINEDASENSLPEELESTHDENSLDSSTAEEEGQSDKNLSQETEEGE